MDSIAPWQSKNATEAEDLNQIGLEFEEKGTILKSSYYLKSLAFYSEIGHKKELAQTHNKVGGLLNNLDKFDEALADFDKALEYTYKSKGFS